MPLGTQIFLDFHIPAMAGYHYPVPKAPINRTHSCCMCQPLLNISRIVCQRHIDNSRQLRSGWGIGKKRKKRAFQYATDKTTVG